MWRNSSRKSEAGLSLIEMLVATAITVVLLSAILGVLLATMRTVSQGHNMQKGFDLARGTYEIVEQDLTNAFASRDTGDHHKFFGTPIGMMFVGSAKGVVSRTAEGHARVSYVIHRNSRADSGNKVDIPLRADDPNTGAVAGDFQAVQAYSLVRFVEPGVSDLDSYNFGPGRTWYDMVRNPENPAHGQAMRAEFAAALNDEYFDIANHFQLQANDPNGNFGATTDQLILIEAKKRELYLRMLAGDPTLPNAFNEVILDGNGEPVLDANGQPQVVPGFLRVNGQSVNWLDYVVAENVAYAPATSTFYEPAMPSAAAPFASAEAAAAAAWDVRPTFFLYGTRTTVQNLSDQFALGSTSGASPRIVELKSPYWGATHNAYMSLYPDAFNGIPDNRRLAIELVMTQHGYDVPAARLGSPLTPRLPELVGLQMGYQLESTFAGVKEFDEKFAQIIDIPTAYSRKKLAAPI